MERLTLLFCGDFAPCRRWNDYEPNISVFGNSLDYIRNSDLAFVNLECLTTNLGKPILKDGPNLKTKSEWLKPLKDAGFNLVGLANNHIGDYGQEAVNDCVDNCRKLSLYTVGVGKNLKEAQKVYYFEKNNIKVAIIAVCEHEYGIAEENKAGTAPLDTIDNIRQIQEAKKNADFVIISVHGGNEYFAYPRPYLRKQCQFYIEQGCDAVICHHPHVPGAYEIYNGKPIFYSLGNFLFDNSNSTDSWNEGYMVKLNLFKNTTFVKGGCLSEDRQGDFSKDEKEKPLCHFVTSPLKKGSNICDNHTNYNLKYELIPYTQSYEQGGIKLMRGSEKESFLNRIEGYRNILNDKEQYEKVWNEFCNSKKNSYLMVQYCPFVFRGFGRLLKIIGVARTLLKNTKRLTGRLNFIRCESHREVLLKILTDILDTRYK